MICKQCGENLAKQERFCPHCGSYFIAAEDETDGRMWKGVITANGTLDPTVTLNSRSRTEAAKATTSSNSSKNSKGKMKFERDTSIARKVWGIIGLASSSLILVLNIIELLIRSSDADALGIFVFPLALAGIIVGWKTKFGKFALLPLIASLIIFIN